MKPEANIEDLLVTALKAEPAGGLPYGFAKTIAKKMLVEKMKRTEIKTYLIAVWVSVTAMGFALLLLSFLSPQLTTGIFAVLWTARYVIGFVALTFVLVEYLDRKWVRC